MNWLSYTLRGVSQIFFVNNPISGALILLAVAIDNPLMALLMLLGTLVQTGVGYLQRHEELVPQGLMGFNGALVGAFAGFAQLPPILAIFVTLLGATACVPVHDVVTRLFTSRPLAGAQLPVSTAPFCIICGVLMTLAAQLAQPLAPTTGSGVAESLELAIAHSFSEVVLSDDIFSGLLIIIALFIGSVQIGLFGLLGMLVANLVAVLLGHPLTAVSAGLHGYSAVLVAIALGATFWTRERAVTRVVGAVVGAALAVSIGIGLGHTPIPVFTWPFLISMWLIMLAWYAVRSRSATRSPQDGAVPTSH